MPEPIAIGLIVGGTLLLFAGGALSVYGVVLFGSTLGGGGGYLVAPSVSAAVGLEGVAAIAVPVGVGLALGAVLGYLLLSIAVSLMSFVVGGFLGLSAIAPHVVETGWYLEWIVAIVIGLIAALLGAFVTKWALVVITSIVGAALASRVLTADAVTTAQQTASIDPLLFDVYSPLFLGLLILGLLSQFGLFKFGYVTRLGRLLPGFKVLPGRRDESDPA